MTEQAQEFNPSTKGMLDSGRKYLSFFLDAEEYGIRHSAR